MWSTCVQIIFPSLSRFPGLAGSNRGWYIYFHFMYFAPTITHSEDHKMTISMTFIRGMQYIEEKSRKTTAEGYSRWKVESRHSKFGKSGHNNWSISKSQTRGRNQVTERVSAPCWHSTPVANAPWKPLVIRWVMFGIRVIISVYIRETGLQIRANKDL